MHRRARVDRTDGSEKDSRHVHSVWVSRREAELGVGQNRSGQVRDQSGLQLRKIDGARNRGDWEVRTDLDGEGKWGRNR